MFVIQRVAYSDQVTLVKQDFKRSCLQPYWFIRIIMLVRVFRFVRIIRLIRVIRITWATMVIRDVEFY